jgi:type II secretory pathway component GspD/PulD (secretin)
MKTILLPAILIVLLLVTPWNKPAAPAAGPLIDFEVKGMPLAKAIRKLEEASGQKIVAGDALNARITISAKQQTLDAILDQIAVQAEAVSMTVAPIYSAESSLRELKEHFRSGAPVSHWAEAARNFSGDRQVVYTFDPQDANPLISVDAESFPAKTLAPIISENAGAYLLLEDQENKKVSITLYDESVDTTVEALARRLGKHWTRLHLLQPRPAELVKIQAGGIPHFAALREAGRSDTAIN